MKNIFLGNALVLLLLCTFTSVSYGQDQLNIVQIDTVFLHGEVAINSDMEIVRDHCFDMTFAMVDTMKYTKEYIKLFNQELKTDIFSTVNAIVGFGIQTTIPGDWIEVMEWHFKDEVDAQKVVLNLNLLERGIIRYPITPTACSWHHTGSKIYILLYNPGSRDHPNKEPQLFFLCLKSLMEEK